MKTVFQLVREVKFKERKELREAVINNGKMTKDGWEYEFNEENHPVIAAYCGDDPADVVVLFVKVDNKENISIIADEKLDRGYEFDLDLDYVFAGQLDYVTSEIISHGRADKC